MLMGDLAGPLVQAASRCQSVDGVILIKQTPHSGKNQVVQIQNSLDVGFRIPEE
jgi:hypothetical protein